MAVRVMAVCGLKNSGKTTLISALVRELSSRGYRTAVIKHDGHDFACDVPGTDSSQFMEAGACGAAVYSEGRLFVHRLGFSGDALALISLFPGADVVIIEGMKDSTLPKMEVVRRGIGDKPVSNPEGRILIVTDYPSGTFAEKQASFEKTGRIADAVLGIPEAEF